MESIASSLEKQTLISSFLEIAVGQSVETAIQFLQATSWQLEEAIQLFYVGNEGGAASGPSSEPSFSAREDASSSRSAVRDAEEDGVRSPLPVVRDVLYDEAKYYGHHKGPVASQELERSKHPDVWVTDQNTTSTTNTYDNLASLYRPPFALMYNGPFDKAKYEAQVQGRWLLVNLQSTEEFNSHMLNRDTWSNEAVVDTVRNNFVFWQVYHDTTEGRKVCTYYNLVSLPAILVIDPITGRKMRAWSGMVAPEELLEDIIPYLDKGPNDHMALPHKHRKENAQTTSMRLPDIDLEDDEVRMAIMASLEGATGVGTAVLDESKSEENVVTKSNQKPSYPPLPEEPKAERGLTCRVGIRLPDGRRLQRNFLRSDPIKLLWSFCHSEVDEAKTRAFHFSQAIPGASKNMEYSSELTLEESGLCNSMISLVWE